MIWSDSILKLCMHMVSILTIQYSMYVVMNNMLKCTAV